MGSSGLHFDLARAAGRDDVQLIQSLLALGANPLAQSVDGNTALMLAVNRGCLAAVSALVEVSDLGARDCKGQTALMKAASRSQKQGGGGDGMVKIIMAHASDASIQAKDDSGLNALMRAVYEDNVEPCGALLSKINPNDMDDKGRTALMLALSYSDDQIVDQLLAVSDIVVKDHKGWVARDYAKEAQRYGFESQLLEMERSILAKKELNQVVPNPVQAIPSRMKTI